MKSFSSTGEGGDWCAPLFSWKTQSYEVLRSSQSHGFVM